MNTGISKSVGRYGINSRSDVLFIQSALNAYAKKHANNSLPLKVDGLCGNKTIQAIFNFQKNHVGIITPDARIDPNGRSFRHLTAGTTSPFTASSPASNNLPISAALNHVHVTYASDIKENRRIVSPYAINVVKLALLESGMTHAVITSTLRTPEDQAEIMYKNAGINFAGQYNLYGNNGKDVLDVYKTNKHKNKDEVIQLMAKKIEDLLSKGEKTSQHCVTTDKFRSLNTFDIGLNSTRLKSKNFNKDKLTKALHELVKQGYVKKFIDETRKSNSCWHLEIVPNSKDINLYTKESMRSPSTSNLSRYV